MSARFARSFGLLVLVVLLFAGGTARAGSTPDTTTLNGGRASQVLDRAVASAALGSNGQHARPFYIFAHNPNRISEANDALALGANALEPDVMYLDCPTVLKLVGLYMYHDPGCGPTRTPDTVASYLDNLHGQVKAGKNLALIAFDTKSAAADHLKGNPSELQSLVASHLNYDGVNVNILYSVANEADANGLFDTLCLKSNEGIMIDGQNDPSAIYNYLSDKITAANKVCPGGVPYNIGFGNGSFGESLGAAPNVILSIDEAAWIRAGQPVSFAVTYAFPIVATRMAEYITAGADGLIPDFDEQPQNFLHTLASIQALHDVLLPTRSDVYLATVADNPFRPRKEAYGLRVTTRDVFNAGTDSDITFKLTGSCGSAQVTFDGSYSSRFEQGHVDYVTVPSKNLGILKTIQLISDGTGVAPGWNPGAVEISSDRWGIPYAAHDAVDFSGETITGSTSATRATGAWGRECDTTPPTAAPTQSPAKNAAGWNNTDVKVNWNWSDNAGGSGVDYSACTTSSMSSGEGNPITLTATCSDLDGNVGTATYTVKVDKTPPSVTVPANITVNATGPNGATVPFSVTAADAMTPHPSITCTINNGATVVTSGATFPIGITTVSCTAKDAADNTAAAKTFTVLVKSAAQQLTDVQTAVKGVGPGTSLVDKVSDVLTAVQKGDPAACDKLTAFSNEVKAQSGKKIAKAVADGLLADAQRIRAVLACT